MAKICESEFNWNAPCLATEYEGQLVCIDMHFIANKDKDDKIMASDIFRWMGHKR